MTESRLYYECHITIDPVFGEELERVREIAKGGGFKVAELLMQKRKEDTAERSKYDTFMTAHSKRYGDIYDRMKNTAATMVGSGFVVRRMKIEDTLFDTKHGDQV